MTVNDPREYSEAKRMQFSGHWREVAWAEKEGIPKALGLTTKEWVLEYCGGYQKLSRDDRLEAVSNLNSSGVSQRRMADITGASLGAVNADVSILNDAKTELQKAAAEGREPTDKEVLDAAKESRDKRRQTKAERRAAREEELAAKQLSLPDKRYGVILADPPWRFEPYSRETGMDRAADNHYPTLSVEHIRRLAIPAAEDAVLFLWATGPMLPQALDVMAAWGFTYRSRCVWVKPKMGTGYWFRDQAEELLVGVRGNIPAPAPGEQYTSVITARAGQHSAKPHCFREMIEEMFPTLPRIELFARERISGWDAWGNELERPPEEQADDFAKSLDVAYDAIRERIAEGGPRGWMDESEHSDV
jgi:N6-adenosine-specific RNA methylase IME4